MFQFTALAPYTYLIGCTVIQGSRDQRLFDGFPELIAAFHALHRLLTPRHPPHALSSLTTMILASQPPRTTHCSLRTLHGNGRPVNKFYHSSCRLCGPTGVSITPCS